MGMITTRKKTSHDQDDEKEFMNSFLVDLSLEKEKQVNHSSVSYNVLFLIRSFVISAREKKRLRSILFVCSDVRKRANKQASSRTDVPQTLIHDKKKSVEHEGEEQEEQLCFFHMCVCVCRWLLLSLDDIAFHRGHRVTY